ncbi:MAG: hypothetical protein CMF46_00430 [Legionellales bacterium]|nr:hypothetical protein [Legionellales bacterium]
MSCRVLTRFKFRYVLLAILWLVPMVLLLRSLVLERHWQIISDQNTVISQLENKIAVQKRYIDRINEKIMLANNNDEVSEEAARWRLGLVKEGEYYYEF